MIARGDRSSRTSTTAAAPVEVVRLPDGSRVLRLQDLRTSDGPKLQVWLADAPVLAPAATAGSCSTTAATSTSAR